MTETEKRDRRFAGNFGPGFDRYNFSDPVILLVHPAHLPTDLRHTDRDNQSRLGGRSRMEKHQQARHGSSLNSF